MLITSAASAEGDTMCAQAWLHGDDMRAGGIGAQAVVVQVRQEVHGERPVRREAGLLELQRTDEVGLRLCVRTVWTPISFVDIDPHLQLSLIENASNEVEPTGVHSIAQSCIEVVCHTLQQ